MSGEKPGLGVRRCDSYAVGTMQCKRYVNEPVEQTVLARWGDVQAQCRVARWCQGLRLKGCLRLKAAVAVLEIPTPNRSFRFTFESRQCGDDFDDLDARHWPGAVIHQ